MYSTISNHSYHNSTRRGGKSLDLAESTPDLVIIGGGTAGCVLANRLSQNPNRRVLLLEAGGRDSYLWLKIPVGYLYCIGNPRTDWLYRTDKENGLGGRDIAYPRGKVMGGCSSINGMIYMRGQAADYDGWRQLGNHGWGWDEILPLFKRSEDDSRGADDWHGSGGGLRVESQRLHWSILDAFREAARQYGINHSIDFNHGDNEGSGYFRVNQRRGFRWNAVQGFLKPIAHRDNLQILTHCLVDRIEFLEGRVDGLWLVVKDNQRHFIKTKNILLAAGAIGSPAILERSGIGKPERLQSLGINTVLNKPAVGENLQDHLQLRCIYRIQGAPTLNQRSRHWWGKAAIGLEYLLRQSGPMSMAPSQLGIFSRSDSSQDRANLQYHVQPLSLEKFGEPLHPFPAFTASVCNLRPTSRGTSHISSPLPEVPPSIRPNYLATQSDQQVAAAAIQQVRKIVSQAALAPYQPEEYSPGVDFISEQDLVIAAGKIGTTIFHPVGTCRMGSDADAVVSPELAVGGVKGLWIADASIMPTITSGNTNAPTTAIAEKASDLIGRLLGK